MPCLVLRGNMAIYKVYIFVGFDREMPIFNMDNTLIVSILK
jgi:hypothetical protein